VSSGSELEDIGRNLLADADLFLTRELQIEWVIILSNQRGQIVRASLLQLNFSLTFQWRVGQYAKPNSSASSQHRDD